MRKFVLKGLVAATGLVMVLAAPASAARPNNRACLGKDASAAARALGGLGGFVSSTSTSAPGAIGAEVQLHLAGEIPDTVFPNTCND